MSTYALSKMAEASRLFHGWEGTTEQPRGTNRIRCAKGNDLWSDVYAHYQGGAYCAAGNVDIYLHVGIDLRRLMTNPYYCPNWVALAKNNGWFKTSGARAGDLVMYGTGGYSVHTGVASPAPGALYYAHEANTGSGNAGSQADGDGVFHRGRGRSWIVGWVDMVKVIDYMIRAGLHTPEKKAAATAPKKPAKAPRLLAVDGELGRNTYKVLQQWVGTKADGVYGPATKRALQRKVGVAADGIVGKQTIRALQKRVGTTVDGGWGPNTTRALQRYLNRGILAGKWTLS